MSFLREFPKVSVFILLGLTEKAMAPHSSTLAWKISWTEEPGALQSMGSQRVRHDWAASLSLFTFHFHALEKEMATHSSVLAWGIPGTGEPGGLPSVGSHRVGHDWNDLAAAAALLHKAKEIYYQIFSSILWFENRWNRSHSYFKMCHCEMTRQKNSWFTQYLF